MDVLEKYKNYLDSTDKKDSTKASYILDIGRLLRHLDADVTDITTEQIQEYCDKLLRTNKQATVSRTLSSARAFWTFLVEQGICTKNPVRGIRPKPPEQNPLPEEVRNVSLSGRKNMQDLRDKSILVLMSKSTIKITELVSLNINSIDIENNRIMLPDGGVVKMHKSTATMLRAYLNLLDSMFVPRENPLLMNRDGGRLSRQGVWKVIKQNEELSEKGA